MKNYGLVSIVTPSFNCSRFIRETIEAIQAQTYNNWELLVTDDCSTDNSREIISEYALADSRIRLLCLDKNSGAGVARNNSIKAAKGRWIAFCDSDDRWLPRKLELQLEFMEQNGVALSYTDYYVCDEESVLCGYVKCLTRLSYAKILRDNGIGCLTAIYDAEKIGKHYMPIIRKRQDWCLWISIIKDCGEARGLQEPLALYRKRSGSISSNKVEMLRYNYRVYHQVLGYSAIISTFLLTFYFLPYYFYKKIKQRKDDKLICGMSSPLKQTNNTSSL